VETDLLTVITVPPVGNSSSLDSSTDPPRPHLMSLMSRVELDWLMMERADWGELLKLLEVVPNCPELLKLPLEVM